VEWERQNCSEVVTQAIGLDALCKSHVPCTSPVVRAYSVTSFIAPALAFSLDHSRPVVADDYFSVRARTERDVAQTYVVASARRSL